MFLSSSWSSTCSSIELCFSIANLLPYQRVMSTVIFFFFVLQLFFISHLDSFYIYIISFNIAYSKFLIGIIILKLHISQIPACSVPT